MLGLALLAFAGVGLYVGEFLAPATVNPRPADAIVVLGGGTGERLRKGMELYRQGHAPRIVLTGFAETSDALLPFYQDWRYRYLVENAVPESAIRVDQAARSSLQEASAVRKLAEAASWGRLVVVSDPPHLRRLSLIYGRVFAGSSTQYQFVATDLPWWDASAWWHDKRAAQFVILELVKLAYHLVEHLGVSTTATEWRS